MERRGRGTVGSLGIAAAKGKVTAATARRAKIREQNGGTNAVPPGGAATPARWALRRSWSQPPAGGRASESGHGIRSPGSGGDGGGSGVAAPRPANRRRAAPRRRHG